MSPDPTDAIPASDARPPRVSVIVPVRNDAQRLRRCLAAVQGSTFRDLEVIVGDDASEDEAAAVAEAAGARVVRAARCGGPAAARNQAARVARGDVLFFVDADVLVRPDAITCALDTFDRRPDVGALFGSYCCDPEHPAFLSQYKNLSHRFVHQSARERATTFWTGCAAIRRRTFLDAGGFDTSFIVIEDIELGARLTRAGQVILVDKRVQGTHLKRWTFAGLLKSDVLDRAVPWTRLILRDKDLPNDLNLGLAQRASAALAVTFVGVWLAACWWMPWLAMLPVVVYGGVWVADALTARVRVPAPLRWLALVVLIVAVAATFAGAGLAWSAALTAPLLAMVALNRRYYAFFATARGPLFALGVLPMHLLYYLYSGFSLAAGVALHLRDARRARARSVEPLQGAHSR